MCGGSVWNVPPPASHKPLPEQGVQFGAARERVRALKERWCDERRGAVRARRCRLTAAGPTAGQDTRRIRSLEDIPEGDIIKYGVG